MSRTPPEISLEKKRTSLYCAVVCDVLDSLGFTRQSPRIPLKQLTASGVLVGRCKTTLWAEIFHIDPQPYELELRAVDSCQPNDVFIAAAGGSTRSGVWGELLSTAALNRGCVGAIVDGAVRDTVAMRRLGFPVFARGTCIYDSRNRQRVVDLDVPVEIDGVCFSPGDLVLADDDGVVVVPREVEAEALRLAWEKVHAENVVRDEIRAGAKAADVFRKYGVL
ncbi:MAG TPA: RraA family protein [Gemmataceae bacterium]|jgi:regulator of RNase E activity RraA|nr:RraA family protein [Gemmataceae bacterium]